MGVDIARHAMPACKYAEIWPNFIRKSNKMTIIYTQQGSGTVEYASAKVIHYNLKHKLFVAKHFLQMCNVYSSYTVSDCISAHGLLG